MEEDFFWVGGGFMACLGLVVVQVLQEEEVVVDTEVVDISLRF